MEYVYLSLGSNIGDKISNIRNAVSMIRDLDGISNVEVSGYYETEPIGYKNQDKFINIVLGCECTYSPEVLLEYIQKIENKMGRIRTIRWGPRIIDVDILTYGNQEIKKENLCIPHERMYQRAFVLVPLVELNKKFRSFLKDLSENDINGVTLIKEND